MRTLCNRCYGDCTLNRIVVVCLIVAVSACSAKSSSTLPTVGATAAALAASGLSLTISRTSVGTKSGSRSPKVILAATRSIDLKDYPGTAASGSPVTTTCAPFPASSSSVTLSFTIPQGNRTLVITAYDGPCSPVAGGIGALGTGVLLSQFSGSGYVGPTSTDIAAVFNKGFPISMGVGYVTPPNKPISASWSSLGPKSFEAGGLASGKLNAFAATPDFRTLLIGGGLGSLDPVGTQAGAWRSVDSGATWLPINNGLGDTIVNSLWIDPSAPTNALAATQFGGIFRSTNLGDSWTQVSSSPTATMIQQIDGFLYASTGVGVQRSSDSGQTWAIDLPTSIPVNSIGGGGGYLYAGLMDGSVWSKSPGSLWNQVTTIQSTSAGNAATAIHQIVNDPAAPLTVYATNGGTNAVGIISNFLNVSLDGGHTWAQAPFPTAGRGAQVIAMSQAVPHQLYVGGTLLMTTADAGKTFTQIGGYGDSRSIFLFPGSPTRVFGCSDEGLFTSVDSGRTFQNLTNSLPVNIVTDMAVGNSSIITGIQDYAPIFSFDSGNSWSIDFSVWGSTENDIVAINPHNSNDCYVFNGSGIWSSGNACKSFSLHAGFGFQNGHESFAFDPSNDAVVYLATSGGVVRSGDHGQTFSSTGWPFSKPRLISIDPQSAKHILIEDASTYATSVSFDGGATWAASNLAAGASSIAVNPVNPYIVLAAASDYYGVKVYRSADGGLTFAQIGAPILAPSDRNRHVASVARVYPLAPPTPIFFPQVSHIRFNPLGNAPYLALGTSRGIFVSTDYGDHFTDISGDAISRVIYAVQWKDGYLYLGTGGQGVIKSTMPIQ